MIDNTTIKSLRSQYNFSQAMLAKATACDPVCISNYENSRRNVTIDTMERIANVFGQTLTLELIDRTNTSLNVDLYKDKTPEEIMELNEKDMIDYIFVKESDRTIQKLCNLEEDIYRRLNFDQIKEILSENMHRCLNADKAIIYNLLTNKYPMYDYNAMDFLCSMHEVINESKQYMSEETISKIENELKFVKIKLDEEAHPIVVIDSIEFLDNDCNDIGISREDVEVGRWAQEVDKEVISAVMDTDYPDYNPCNSKDVDSFLINKNKEWGVELLKRTDDGFEFSGLLSLDEYRQLRDLGDDLELRNFITLNPVIRFRY